MHTKPPGATVLLAKELLHLPGRKSAEKCSRGFIMELS